MFNLDQFQQEAFESLTTRTVDSLVDFIEKWVPEASNTISALQQENKLLDLQLTASWEEQP